MLVHAYARATAWGPAKFQRHDWFTSRLEANLQVPMDLQVVQIRPHIARILVFRLQSLWGIYMNSDSLHSMALLIPGYRR